MKYSNTALKELSKRYKNILIKCALFNAAAFISFTGIAHADVITAKGIETGTVTDFILTYNNKYSGAVYALGGGDVSSFSLATNVINFQDPKTTNARTVLARLGGSIYLGGENTSSINIVSDNYTIMSVGNAAGDTSFISLNGKDISITSTANSSVYAEYGSKVEIEGNNVSINAAKYGVQVFDDNSLISLKGDNISINAHTYDYASSLYAGLGGAISVIGKNITLTSDQIGITNLSGAQTNIEGNLTINAPKAIVTRGKTSVITINETGNYTSKINGDISFEYDETTSGDFIDATVNLTLNGADSYWKGNLISDWDGTPSEEKLTITKGLYLTLNDGATWTATPVQENLPPETLSVSQVTVNKGVINVQSNAKAIVKNMTVNGDLTLNGTLTTVADGTITFKDGSSLTTTLDTSTVKFDGEGTVSGTINLTSLSAGEYAFASESVNTDQLSFTNNLYNIAWSDETKTNLSITQKSTEEITNAVIGETSASAQEATALAAMVSVEGTGSEKGNELASLISSAIQSGDTAAAVEAVKQAAPTTAQVIQGVAKEAASTVARLSSARMDAVKGRSGGDIYEGAGLWMQAIYNHTKQDSTSSSDGFKADSEGIALGVDKEISSAVTLGVGYGYMKTDVDSYGREMDVDGHNFFVYGKYQPSQWYVSSVLSYNYSKYSEKKSPMGVSLRSDYDVSSYGAQMMTGYEFKNGFTPEAGLRYLIVDADSYFDGMQRISSDSDDVLTAVMGVKYQTTVKAKCIDLKPHARVALTYDLISDNSNANVSVLGGSSYSIEGNRLHRLGAEADVGVTATIKNVDLTLEYNGAFRQDYTSQGGMLRLKYHF